MSEIPKAEVSAAALFPAQETPVEGSPWQRDMQSAFRSLESLQRFLELDAESAPPRLSDPAFPLLTTRSFAERMRKGDWNDPLLLQVLPVFQETQNPPGFCDDAVGDMQSQVVPGLLHKYASRALMMVSPNCAIHCRYCFRREFPYGEMPRLRDHWEQAWAYLEAHPGVDELILSGGDPLFLDNRRLETLCTRVLALRHVRTLRIHTRLPVVLPSRMDPGLLGILSEFATHKNVIVVIHSNHPAELQGECLKALAALRSTGALLLNQSVLLKGINADADTLAELSRRLVRNGVLPYYLHQLDRVTGSAHFEVSAETGLALIESLRKQLPGYAVPRYVREVAGEESKLPVSC